MKNKINKLNYLISLRLFCIIIFLFFSFLSSFWLLFSLIIYLFGIIFLFFNFLINLIMRFNVRNAFLSFKFTSVWNIRFSLVLICGNIHIFVYIFFIIMRLNGRNAFITILIMRLIFKSSINLTLILWLISILLLL